MKRLASGILRRIKPKGWKEEDWEEFSPAIFTGIYYAAYMAFLAACMSLQIHPHPVALIAAVIVPLSIYFVVECALMRRKRG